MKQPGEQEEIVKVAAEDDLTFTLDPAGVPDRGPWKGDLEGYMRDRERQRREGGRGRGRGRGGGSGSGSDEGELEGKREIRGGVLRG